MTVRRRPSPRTVLAIASLGGVIAFVDATIVNIAFPDITRSFPDAPVSSLSWVLNAYNVVFAAFLIAGAGMAESLGRRRVFVIGLELFTVGSLLCAVAPSAGALIAFRVVQALGAALLVPSALALVLQAIQPARRSHAVALLSAVSAAAAGFPTCPARCCSPARSGHWYSASSRASNGAGAARRSSAAWPGRSPAAR